ncbi:MAG TPA: hypothetical protein VFB38_18790 [Chthonomonadaceae bacterium]|nr:hypothetical protein [Chthonomonadaceae bacterium]
MTVYELYDQTIKPLPAEERLRLAKLILNDLSPDEETLKGAAPERPSEIRDQDHLEELLLAGLNSPKREMTKQDWAALHQAAREAAGQKA